MSTTWQSLKFVSILLCTIVIDDRGVVVAAAKVKCYVGRITDSSIAAKFPDTTKTCDAEKCFAMKPKNGQFEVHFGCGTCDEEFKSNGKIKLEDYVCKSCGTAKCNGVIVKEMKDNGAAPVAKVDCYEGRITDSSSAAKFSDTTTKTCNAEKCFEMKPKNGQFEVHFGCGTCAEEIEKSIGKIQLDDYDCKPCGTEKCNDIIAKEMKDTASKVVDCYSLNPSNVSNPGKVSCVSGEICAWFYETYPSSKPRYYQGCKTGCEIFAGSGKCRTCNVSLCNQLTITGSVGFNVTVSTGSTGSDGFNGCKKSSEAILSSSQRGSVAAAVAAAALIVEFVL